MHFTNIVHTSCLHVQIFLFLSFLDCSPFWIQIFFCAVLAEFWIPEVPDLLTSGKQDFWYCSLHLWLSNGTPVRCLLVSEVYAAMGKFAGQFAPRFLGSLSTQSPGPQGVSSPCFSGGDMTFSWPVGLGDPVHEAKRNLHKPAFHFLKDFEKSFY
jgi:hypothetical protein